MYVTRTLKDGQMRMVFWNELKPTDEAGGNVGKGAYPVGTGGSLPDAQQSSSISGTGLRCPTTSTCSRRSLPRASRRRRRLHPCQRPRVRPRRRARSLLPDNDPSASPTPISRAPSTSHATMSPLGRRPSRGRMCLDDYLRRHVLYCMYTRLMLALQLRWTLSHRFLHIWWLSIHKFEAMHGSSISYLLTEYSIRGLCLHCTQDD